MADFEGTVINAASADDWLEVRCPGTMLFTFQVFDAGILYQLGRGVPALSYAPRQFALFPGFHTRARLVDGLRFKSLLAGAPARVTLETATPNEIGEGGELV